MKECEVRRLRSALLRRVGACVLVVCVRSSGRLHVVVDWLVSGVMKGVVEHIWTAC